MPVDFAVRAAATPRRPLASLAALVLALAASVAPAPVNAEVGTVGPAAPVAPVADAPYKEFYQIDYVVRPDGLLDTTQRIEYQVGVANAVQAIGQQRYSVNEHFYDLEIVEAATLKADGRRIGVPADRILEQIANPGQQAIFEADIKVKTVVFPDLAVGDRTRVVMRYRQKREQTPGGFYRANVFAASSRIASARITFDVPAAMKLKVFADRLEQSTELQGDRVRHTWVYNGQPYRSEESGSILAIDREPRLIVSSFPDWEAAGRSFWTRAAPMGEPTPEIRALADKITAGITDRREQARAILDWVSTNIRYVAIFLGSGGFVPHEAESVLTNRYGDCKDHTTLMRALLTSKGIPSEYALINMRAQYKAYEVPAPSFDHVILYLPEQGIYTDPTSPTSSFGVLPPILYDKVVLRSGPNGVTAARTPKMGLEQNRTVVRTVLDVRPDGSLSGTAETEGTGIVAGILRGAMSSMESQGAGEFARRNLLQQGLSGNARIEPRSPSDHADPYIVRSTFTIDDHVLAPDTNRAVPLGPVLIGRPAQLMRTINREGRQSPFICYTHTYREEITLRMPEGRVPAVLPKDMTLHHPLADYASAYRRDGREVRITRELTMRMAGSVCSVDVAHQLRGLLDGADLDFRRIVKLAEATPAAAPAAKVGK